MNTFDRIEPKYYIDSDMEELIKEINKKLDSINISDDIKKSNMIKKSRVRSIHSSLSIENNSLSLFDVDNIFNNKKVLGKRDEVLEVKNAIEAYNHIHELNYKSEEDIIKVHNIMMKYLDEDNGYYRTHGEGVEKDGMVIYMAPDSIIVPSLMRSLFEFINNSDLNLIIVAAIFHYYFVSIHPFSDGNGRLARYWVSLMLINYNSNFLFIPIEEEIYLNQKDYYASITECHFNMNANVFIRFLLNTINSSLDKVINNNINSFNINSTQNKIIELITNNNSITQKEIANIIGLDIRTIKRHFKVLIDNNIIERVGSDKTGYWKVL